MQNATYHIRRRTHLRRLCKLLLNLSILALFGFLVWFGGELFTGQWPHSPAGGATVFVAALIALILLFRLGIQSPWPPSMGITVLSLVLLFAILAFAGVEPLATYKDTMVAEVKQVGQFVRHEVPQYVQSPIETRLTVSGCDSWGYPFTSSPCTVTVAIIPTAAARLDTEYKVRVTSPYWEYGHEWAIFWSEDPALKAPEARGFRAIERTFTITSANRLHEHISQLEYRKLVQQLDARPMREIEADYQAELAKLLHVEVSR